jgi:hypothetical protein
LILRIDQKRGPPDGGLFSAWGKVGFDSDALAAYEDYKKVLAALERYLPPFL